MKPIVSQKIIPKPILEAKDVKKRVPKWVKNKINKKLYAPQSKHLYIDLIDQTNEN